uniref:Uncharacterized protein n=1 Tax=viral metagenome TaxID=1070528 RepID=A0A6H2A0F6_9ZZZZ
MPENHNPNIEHAIEGWEAIAKLFNVNSRQMLKRREELSSAGAIFYRLKGTPPRKIVCAFPSLLKAWICRKAAKGEKF